MIRYKIESSAGETKSTSSQPSKEVRALGKILRWKHDSRLAAVMSRKCKTWKFDMQQKFHARFECGEDGKVAFAMWQPCCLRALTTQAPVHVRHQFGPRRSSTSVEKKYVLCSREAWKCNEELYSCVSHRNLHLGADRAWRYLICQGVR
jgi:hypothetical protein